MERILNEGIMKHTILLVLFVHFVADFILQSDKMAINKSTSMNWLGLHVLVYGLGLCILIPFGFSWQWVVINTSLHFFTDAITSRISSYLYLKGMRHWFFVCIGVDQLIHYTCLILTLGL